AAAASARARLLPAGSPARETASLPRPDWSRRLPQSLTHAFFRGCLRIGTGKRSLRLRERVAELDERVSRDEVRLRRERRRRLRLPDRAEPFLQLQHDPLGGLLADSRNCLEARRVLERDRPAQLVRRRARDDRQRNL